MILRLNKLILIVILSLYTYTAYSFPNKLKEGDVEVYSVDLGSKSKTFYYAYDKDVSPGMAIARAGYAGKYITYVGLITVDELKGRQEAKQSALKKLNLTQEEYEALDEP